jgi:hypothetical protein
MTRSTATSPRSTALQCGCVSIILLMVGFLVMLVPGTYAQEECRRFEVTGKTVCGTFLRYWDAHGGLAQQGYPISERFQELSQTDGRHYIAQYFERAVFELHPKNQPPHDVLLSLLGTFEYNKRYGTAGAPNQRASTDNPRLFSETGKTVGGRFRDYWEQNGGLPQQGLPISDEFVERNNLNGREYTVQYFERAVFELHPENQPPYDVLLSQLGTFRFKDTVATCDGFRKLRGPVIAEGRNAEPTRFLDLESYSIEEVVLPGSLTCVVNISDSRGRITEQIKTFDRFYRIAVATKRSDTSIVAGWFIWIDDMLAGQAAIGHSEVVAILYDRTLLREGATLSVSYGAEGQRVAFPQTLHFSSFP